VALNQKLRAFIVDAEPPQKRAQQQRERPDCPISISPESLVAGLIVLFFSSLGVLPDDGESDLVLRAVGVFHAV